MKIRPVEAETDRQAEMTKLLVVYRNFGMPPKFGLVRISYPGKQKCI
jgi:hypothetical protein